MPFVWLQFMLFYLEFHSKASACSAVCVFIWWFDAWFCAVNFQGEPASCAKWKSVLVVPRIFFSSEGKKGLFPVDFPDGFCVMPYVRQLMVTLTFFTDLSKRLCRAPRSVGTFIFFLPIKSRSFLTFILKFCLDGWFSTWVLLELAELYRKFIQCLFF